jgi:Domain of unknown function (DUF5666)
MHDRSFGSLAVICIVAILTPGLASSGLSRSAQASTDDLQVGQTVAIEGKSAGARTVNASEIEIQEESSEEKLKGRIQTIDTGANSLVVLGTKVFAAGDAQIAARDGSTIPFSSLQKGWMVKVKGSLQGEGTLQASEIRVGREEAPDEAEVEGRVQTIDKARSTMTVAGLTIRLTPATKIKFD